MGLIIDQALGIHADALRLRAARAELLANNLANADTPGFKAQDIDFAEALKQLQDGNSSATLAGNSSSSHQLTGTNSLNIKYREPKQGSLDGNTVDKHQEVAQFSQNALQYQATLNFMNDRIRNLMTALRGE